MNARFFLLLLITSSLPGCMESGAFRVGVFVLIPFALLIWLVWFVSRRPGSNGEGYQGRGFPDYDQDD